MWNTGSWLVSKRVSTSAVTATTNAAPKTAGAKWRWSSSSTKARPARGALKAAARPAFAPERQAATNADDAAKEFHQENSLPAHRAEPIEDRFHMRNTTAGGFGGEAVHHADRQPGTECPYAHGEKPPPGRSVMRPGDELVTQEVTPIQRPAKQHRDTPCQ